MPSTNLALTKWSYLTWAIFSRMISLHTRSCLHFISSFSLLVWRYDHFYYWLVLHLNLVFWGGSSFMLLFCALAWSHFLDCWSLVPISTFHFGTLSNIFLNTMHKKYKCMFLRHFIKYIMECNVEKKYKCQFLRHFLKYITLCNSEKNINVTS